VGDDRPVSEVLQPRGFAVGFALRLAMFFSLCAGFNGSARFCRLEATPPPGQRD